MRTFTPKVNRHVKYVTPSGRIRSATITSVTNPTTVNLRIGRHTTLTGVSKESGPDQSSVWRVAKTYVPGHFTPVVAGLTNDFLGTTLPSGWTFDSPLGAGSVAVADSRATITWPSTASYDSISTTTSPDNSIGIVHAITTADVDVAIQVDTDVSDRRGWGVNLICKGSGTDAFRASWYHPDNNTDNGNVFAYGRASGAGASLGNLGLTTFMTGIPAWLRLQYVSATGTWNVMHSTDGWNWITFYSGVRAFTPISIKVSATSVAASGTRTGGSISINKVVNVLTAGTDLRNTVPARTATTVFVMNAADLTLPAEMVNDSGGLSTVTLLGTAIRFTHDATQDADSPTRAGSRLKYVGTRYAEWGMLLKVDCITTNANCFFVPSCGVDDGTPIDQYSRGTGYGLEIQLGAIRRPIRVKDNVDSNVVPATFSTGLNEVPYCWLKDLTAGTSFNAASGIHWFRIEKIGDTASHRRLRAKEWLDGTQEPTSWNLFDGQDETHTEPMGPELILSHNDVKTGTAIVELLLFEFYRFVP